MTHTRVMIFSPGKVEPGVIFHEATDEEIYDMLYISATTEASNGRKPRGDKATRDIGGGR